MKLWDEFKKFAFKGNVVDMAIGVVIGGAFGAIVSSLVADIIMPLVGLLTGGINFSDLKIVLSAAVIENGEVIKPENALTYGTFIEKVLYFFIVALSIFAVIKIMNTAKEKREQLLHKNKEAEAPAPEAPAAPTEAELLTEIRDLLKENKKSE